MARKTGRKRRGRGEGSVYQEGDRWKAIITIGYDEKGRRKRRKVSGTTKAEVLQKLTKLHGQSIDGTLTEASTATIAQFLRQWLDDCCKATVRESTFSNYETQIRLHINPRIGGIRLSRLTPTHIQAMLGDMQRSGRSGRLRRLAYVVLNRALGQALKWGIIPRNPCAAVDPPRYKSKEIRPLTTDQVKLLLQEARGDRWEMLYVLAIATGMRQGELLGLRWDDIDLEKGSVQIRRTVSLVRGKPTIGEPKSERSRRRIELPAMAVAALHEHRKRMLAQGHGGVPWVFCNEVGGLVDKNNMIRRSFKPLLKRAGLPDVRFHDLRHTMATIMLSLGEHPKVVQERLGHSSIAMTLDIYSHVMPSLQRDAADRLGQVLGETDCA